MIKLFQAEDRLFSSNGDKIIQATKCKVHKEDNGEFYLELECNLEYIDFIKQNNILVVNTPRGDQAFRIDNVEQTRSKIKTKAYHIFYDSENYLIEDSYVVDKNCNDALNHLNDATDNQSPFTMTSNINNVNSYRCVRTSLCEAIKVVLERWGGHLVRDNFNIQILDEIGQDNGVVVRYGKNLKNIVANYNWNDVVTKLMPVGKDGLLLDEKYIYSETQYAIPYTKTISFTQDINEEDYQENGVLNESEYINALKEDLRVQAVEYITKSQFPSVNYTLNANLEKVSDIGDTIEVIDEVLDINIMTHLIAYDYDCILGKYTELQFGNFTQKLNGLVDNINTRVQKEVDEKNESLKITLRDELEVATDKIWNALGSSYVIYDGDKILILDQLPKEEAVNVIMINSGGIGFSNNGINGTFRSAWTIDNKLNMENINVINLTADLIKGGTLKLGGYNDQSGKLELYNEDNNEIGELTKNGLKMYGVDGSYVLINNEVGFSGYDFNNNRIFWADKDTFHMQNADIQSGILLNDRVKIIPISQYAEDGINIQGYGVGFVSISTEDNAKITENRIILNKVEHYLTENPGSIDPNMQEYMDQFTNIYLKVIMNANYDFSNYSPVFKINYSWNPYGNTEDWDEDMTEYYDVDGVIASSSSMTYTNNVYSKTYYIKYPCGAVGRYGKIWVNSIYAQLTEELATEEVPITNYEIVSDLT